MKISSLPPMLAFAACSFAQTPNALPGFTRDYNFPPVGLASSETAQVNVVNIAQSSSAANAVAPDCSGTITFTNASGKAIGTPASFSTTGSQVFSTQLAFNQLAAAGPRAEFVASVQLTGALPPTTPCSLVFSLETFDNSSGVTHVYLGNSATGTTLIAQPIGLR